MSFTSDEQLAELQDTYGLTLGQARAMAAKAANPRTTHNRVYCLYA